MAARDVIDISAIVLSGILLIPVGVLCIECLAAVFGPRRSGSSSRPAPVAPGEGGREGIGQRSTLNIEHSTLREENAQPRGLRLKEEARTEVAVLIPAHNEEGGIARTLGSIRPQLLVGDRLIVVADNCTDGTAAVARGEGAMVIERNDPVNRGKGYALDRGIRDLAADPPAVVVMMDADCRVGEGAIERLARQVMETGRPAQAAYVMDCPKGSGPRASISALAFIVKNVVRPLGLKRLGMPCLLTGTGMAFPWGVIRDAHLATGNIVEDMQLGIELALAGHAPVACPEARVMGVIESKPGVAYTQRTRWEHGHLATLLTAFPRLVGGAITRGSPRLLALAMEVAVPPLALLVLVMGAALVGAVGWWMVGGSATPVYMLVAGCAGLCLSLLLAWGRFARQVVSLGSLLAVPFYVAWKVPMYFAFLFRREKQWVRTARGNEEVGGVELLRPAQS